jgi:hypothetical protein
MSYYEAVGFMFLSRAGRVRSLRMESGSAQLQLAPSLIRESQRGQLQVPISGVLLRSGGK